MLCREIVAREIDLEEAKEALCYPLVYPSLCIDRLRRLRSIGVEKVLDYGRVNVGRIRIVGKGHAATVVLAKHRELGIVALKMRRMDSKRMSLVDEGELMKIASSVGVAPKVFAIDDDFIVREFVDGSTLREFLSENLGNVDTLRKLFAELLRNAYRLDEVGIDLVEISNPLTQVVVECGDPSKPRFIDFESGRKSERATNVTKIVAFIVGRMFSGTPVRDLLRLGIDSVERLRSLASNYKKASAEERRRIVEEMLRLVEGLGNA